MSESLYFITITGVDRIGIVARISGAIFRYGGNIVDSYQRIIGKYFIIGLLVDMGPPDASIQGLLKDFAEIEQDWGLRILVQHEDGFLPTSREDAGSEKPAASTGR
jgi:ACT domain-containing protein